MALFIDIMTLFEQHFTGEKADISAAELSRWISGTTCKKYFWKQAFL